jgi:hypothetical protein
MRLHMPDSHLNRAERSLQHSFIKLSVFNGLMMATAVWAAYIPIRALPARQASPPAIVGLSYDKVEIAPAGGLLRVAGAWKVKVTDPRFGGISSLTIDRGRFLAVSDRGSVARFDLPGMSNPRAWVADLRDGPGPWGRKRARDAESLAADPSGRGWWVGFEQDHSIWLYDRDFRETRTSVALNRPDWWDNRGAEGLVADGSGVLVLAENGREAMRVGANGVYRVLLRAGADVADAATAPDGGHWLLLRTKGAQGINQAIAPLVPMREGYRAGPAIPVPKGAFDNYEGMAIEPQSGGKLRFWLITDDGHRIMARTLLIALDYVLPVHDKGSAEPAEPSKNRRGRRA